MSDVAILKFSNGTQAALPWNDPIPTTLGTCSEILVNRMPMTMNERAWFWGGLTSLLAPGASIKMARFD